MRLGLVVFVLCTLHGIVSPHPVSLGGRDDPPDCRQCKFIVGLLTDVWGTQATEDCLGDFVAFVCQALNIEDHFVCTSIGTDFEEEAQYIVGKLLVNPEDICALLLDDCGTFFDPFTATWSVDIPGGKPPVQPYPNPSVDKPKLRVLHLSDIHIDPEYTEGLEADCSEPQCCRPLQDPNEVNKAIKKPAGHWGSVAKCDSPFWLVSALMDHIASTHTDLDYAVVSGDLESHAVWDYTKEKHITMVRNISGTIRNALPKVPAYFAVGNHEGVPIDNFPPSWVPEKFNMSWMYNTMADAWGPWIGDEAAKEVQFNGCYMKKILPGLRIISLNTPLGDTTNFYLYINQTDPDGAMSWLVSQLADAEKVGDKVHIVAHIPSGNGEALEGWSINYYNVINRFRNLLRGSKYFSFESTIAAQFFGHTHTDEYHMTYEDPEDQNTRPTSVILSTPSVTPYSESQPAYRIYTIDGNYPGSSFAVLDYEEYYVNLTEANAKPSTPPEWKVLFKSVKEEYGLKSMAPQEWSDLITRMNTDDALFAKYRKNHYRRDDLGACDENCKHSMLCNLRRAHHTSNLCGDLQGTFNLLPRKKHSYRVMNELEVRKLIEERRKKKQSKDQCPL